LRRRRDRPIRCWYALPDAVCCSLGRAGAGSATAGTRTRLLWPAAAELLRRAAIWLPSCWVSLRAKRPPIPSDYTFRAHRRQFVGEMAASWQPASLTNRKCRAKLASSFFTHTTNRWFRTTVPKWQPGFSGTLTGQSPAMSSLFKETVKIIDGPLPSEEPTPGQRIFRAWLRGGYEGLTAEYNRMYPNGNASPEVKAAFEQTMRMQPESSSGH
jgi:hypothetical protein